MNNFKSLAVRFIIFAAGLSIFVSCNHEEATSENSTYYSEDFTQSVNPFIGTSKMGHVFPGATAPF